MGAALALSCVSCATPRVATFETHPVGRLTWGPENIESWKRAYVTLDPTPIGSDLRSLIADAEKRLGQASTISVTSRIDREGVLPEDAKYLQSQKALEDLDIVFKWTLCARVAPQALATRCEIEARASLLKWAHTYKPTGNPINENELIPLFLSFDLFQYRWTESERSFVNDWLLEFVKKGDSYIANQRPNAIIRRNNHNTWRLAIRTLIGRILTRPDLEAETRQLVARQAQENLLPPTWWRPSSACENNRDEPRYGSLDFRQRDALHYHVYDLKAWSWIALLAPDLMHEKLPRGEITIQQTLKEAIDFLRPYYLGERHHREFVCSRVDFDRKRREAGVPHFQNTNWNPAPRADQVLLTLSIAFPEVSGWIEKRNLKLGQMKTPPWLLLIQDRSAATNR